jgi:DNA-binding LacI/PurR family transcriptional regulator
MAISCARMRDYRRGKAMPRATESRLGKATGRPRIGFVAGFPDDAYGWALWQSVRRTIEQHGGSAVYFSGTSLEDADPERRARSRIFDFVRPSGVDALLCLSGVLGHFVGVPGTERWLLQRGLLACSIGTAEHVPSVTVDDSSGVTLLMRHLIRHHKHTRIAFVTGNPSNAEAQRRLSTYIQVLADHGIGFDPRLTLTGDFTAASGARAIQELFDARQIPADSLDAVVCSNDDMAFGVIEELVRRRIHVPDKVAVVGFDDMPRARIHNPSLTTVRQPLEELGRQGALRILSLVNGAAAEGALTLETELVLRRSCGCLPTDIPPPPTEPDEAFEPSSSDKPLSGVTLETALAAELGGAPGTFSSTLEPYLRRLAGSTPELEHGRRFAEDLAQHMRLAREDLVHQRLSRLARALHQRMFGPQAQISTALAELMPALGMHECVVSELVPRRPGETKDTLKLAFGFDAKNLQPHMASFDAGQLVPPAFDHLRASSCLVLPLTFGTDTLGVAVVPASDRDGAFYEALAELFRTVLKVLELRRRAERP